MPNGVDTSLYPKAPAPGDALNQIRAVIDVAGKARQYQADTEAGEIYQRSTGENGVNTDIMQQLLRQAPAAAIHAPQMIQDATAANAVLLAHKATQQDRVYNEIGALLGKPRVSKEDIFEAVGRMHGIGITDPVLNQTLSEVARDSSPANIKRIAAIVNNISLGAAGRTAIGPVGIDAGTGQVTQGSHAQAVQQSAQGGFTTTPPAASDASAQAYAQESLAASQHHQVITPFKEAMRLADKLPEGSTGPGKVGIQRFQEFVHGISPELAQSLGINPEIMRTRRDLDKWLNTGQASQLGGFGHGTGAQLDIAASGNPSISMNDLSVRDMIRMRIAMQRALDTQRKEAAIDANGGNNVYGFIKKGRDLGSRIDPRAFLADLLTKDKRAALNEQINSEGPEAVKRFMYSLELGKKHQMFDRDMSPGAK